MFTGPVRRRRIRCSLVVFIALGSLATACSSDGGRSVDVESELAADILVVEYASRIAGVRDTPPSLDPQTLGAIIAAAIDDLVTLTDEGFRDAGGTSRRDRADQVGTLMGLLATDLGKVAADNGRQARVDTTAYALELLSAIAFKSAAGPDDDDRTDWLVPSASALSDDARADLDDDLAAGDFESAAERLIDKVDDFGPFHAIDAAERKLESIVPADDDGYPRDDLRSAYRFTVSVSTIGASVP